jgi:hypothetical protein
MDKTARQTAILKRDVLGRVTHTRQQREALLDEFERSGMKGLPFARMAGVNYQTFASWMQKRRRARGGYPKGVVQPAGCGGKAALQLVEVELPATAASRPVPDAAVTLELLLPGGARLLLHDARQAELAAHLLRNLSASPSC